ncbi:MAG: hypothetical protein K6G87_08360 [Butyrivibrio sp.]|uniref:hypothetical protein n=1 Tax=Butyrivibrio sp. TaxID=28121 RepID=UPI0025E034CF|nr:hypothetical protein [Butyrivibrio sp.]MCR5771226.1 hypothetical protein [Butyrivibrio sp.]
MRKIIKIVAIMAMSLSLCACRVATETTLSETGKITVTVNNNKVKLNHVEFEFPEDYSLKEGLIKDPYGMSYVNVKNDDGELIGVAADGMYSEDIDEDNIADAVNDIYMAFHDVDEPLQMNEDPFVYGDELTALVIQLEDGYAIFIAENDTPNFVYTTQVEDADEDDAITDFIKSAVEQMGSEEDYEAFFGA